MSIRDIRHVVPPRAMAVALLSTTAVVFSSAACAAGSCLHWFDAQPRYRAVKAFDRPAFDRMRERVRAFGSGEPGCGTVEAALAPLLENNLNNALRLAPDDAVVAYAAAKLELARALSSANPAACEHMLMTPEKVTAAERAAAVATLPAEARRSFNESQTRLLLTARSPGPRTPAYTLKEAYDHSDDIRKTKRMERAVDPNASAEERCTGSIELFEAMMNIRGRGRVRSLRMLTGP
jgi:hypothetical protein